MNKFKVTIIGHFGFGKNYLDGQTVKTKIVSMELKRKLGENNVREIDTHGRWSSFFKAPLKTLSAVIKSKNVVMLPAHGGLRVYTPWLLLWSRFSITRLHYVVIGGWLPQYLDDKKSLEGKLKKFDGIYVETKAMKTVLEQKGFKNIYIMPNCKRLNLLRPEELVYNTEEPFKLCTFSRVTEKKGIGDAVEAVRQINEKNGRTVYTLDIYGQVDDNQTEWFEKLKKTFPEYVHYCGLVPFDKSVDVLKNYFALLFPTSYYGEGFAGTLIDAFAAGVPIVASDWKYNPEIIENNNNGIMFKTGDNEAFVNILTQIATNAERWNSLKINCLKSYEKYSPESVVKILSDRLDG